jgi:drug/metabolite transporter (DMT)-like permease
MEPVSKEKLPPFNPYLALVSGVLGVSTGAIFARLAEAPALVIAAYRLGLATLALTPIAWWKGREDFGRLSFRDFKLAILSGSFLALHFAAWISSLDFTSVANSVVLVNTNPLWVALLSPLLARERIAPMALLGIMISVIGGGIIGAADFTTGDNALLGDALALAGSVCMAVYLLIGRSLRQKLSLLPYIVLCYGSAAVILWILVAVSRQPISGFSHGTYAAFLAMAVISQLIGHTSYNWALRWFAAGLVAVSLLGEPVGATILAYFLLDESLTWAKFAGGSLILAGIYLTAFFENRKKST